MTTINDNLYENDQSEHEGKRDILPEPQFKRIPVRVDKNTIILVREGLNVEEHLKRFKDKDNTPPGYIPWF